MATLKALLESVAAERFRDRHWLDGVVSRV